MTKKDDGTFIFKAAPEDFPQKHKGVVVDMAIADTGSLHTFVTDRYQMKQRFNQMLLVLNKIIRKLMKRLCLCFVR